MEQKINTKFFLRQGKKPQEKLKQLYEEEVLSLSRTFELFIRFPDGRVCVKDKANAECPHSVCTLETIEKVRILSSDCRLKIRVLANELNISNEIVTQIFAKRLDDVEVIKKTMISTLQSISNDFKICFIICYSQAQRCIMPGLLRNNIK